MNAKLYAVAAAVLVVAACAQVAVAPGVVLPLAAVLLMAELALAAAGAWPAVWLVRGFRSSPRWRPVARPVPAGRWMA